MTYIMNKSGSDFQQGGYTCTIQPVNTQSTVPQSIPHQYELTTISYEEGVVKLDSQFASCQNTCKTKNYIISHAVQKLRCSSLLSFSYSFCSYMTSYEGEWYNA